MERNYLPRIADGILQKKLKTNGAVLIEGPKWCGKTWTASEISNSTLFMQDPDKRASYLKTADTKPSLLLKGDKPRLLDEWQTAPVLWDAVRFDVDSTGLHSQYILTGSAVPTDNAVQHSGTGRIARMTMHPMSLFESGESEGTVSLQSLFDGTADIEAQSSLAIEDIAAAICRGGWPAAVTDESPGCFSYATDYVEAVINQDISRVDGVEKNPTKVRALMRSLSRNISTLTSLHTIYEDTSAYSNELSPVSDKTISSYLTALDRIFVTENIPAWNPALRSKTAIRTSPKRQFTDPSIAAATLRLTPERLLDDFEYFGFLFESLCERDLRIYAEAIDGSFFHYKDKSGLECDAVICLNDGRWGAVEIKLGSKEIEDACTHLLQLKDKVNTEKMREPSFLMVLTGTEYAYRRPDGVFITPIGCLKP